jgi:hypothetical protein
VHYPLFRFVGAAAYPEFQRTHESRIGRLVAPAMTLELLGAVALPFVAHGALPPALPRLGLVLLGVVWLSTAFLQVPQHRRLHAGWDAAAHRRLVATNWVRTAAWSARAVLALYMMRELARRGAA